MSLAEVFNELGQDIIPSITAEVFPDTMDILGETTSKGSWGGNVKSAATEVYSDVPVTWKKHRGKNQVVVGDKPIAYGNYLLEFPVYHNGARINLTAGHKLKVLARGLEPEKIFSIVEIFDNQGVTWQVEAKKE